MIAKNLGDLIGNTPMLLASRLAREHGMAANVLVKLEYFNPAGSVKDRIGWFILEEAEKAGELEKGTVIVEPTSGNTGIGLAMAARVKGYRIILTMPETMSKERRSLLAAYGAELVLTEAALGMAGSVSKAEELAKNLPKAFMPRQFENPVNWQTHYKTTAEEIWHDTGGDIDILVAGVGTGGTITGISKRLKELKHDVWVVAVEPKKSPLLSKGMAGPHGFLGIGANFVPKVLDRSCIDEVLTVTEDDAYKMAREFAETEGLLIGISAGAALSGAAALAWRHENMGKNIVVILPDSGERYLSTDLFGSQK